MNGAELIAAERQRQIDAEGWTPEHDDEYDEDELRWAAACYMLPVDTDFEGYDFNVRCWPWDRAWWKPSDDPIRNLVKAGALVAAEIDRLERAAIREGRAQ